MASGRTVIANFTLSLDGRMADAGGGMGWLVAHANDDRERASFEGVWRGASTALLGRNNYDGFHGYWPAVANDPDANPRDRDMASWLNDVEKVVFSRTMTDAMWSHARVATRPLEEEVRALKDEPGRDIVILNSISIIRQLLAAGLVDELRILFVPTILGGGPRLFDDGLPLSEWRAASTTVLPSGGLVLHLARV
jgi:dihydrofolate reductase